MDTCSNKWHTKRKLKARTKEWSTSSWNFAFNYNNTIPPTATRDLLTNPFIRGERFCAPPILSLNSNVCKTRPVSQVGELIKIRNKTHLYWSTSNFINKQKWNWKSCLSKQKQVLLRTLQVSPNFFFFFCEGCKWKFGHWHSYQMK